MSNSSPSSSPNSKTISAVAGPPRRYIFNDDDMEKFLASPAKAELLRLTQAMGKSCAAAAASTSTSTYTYNPQEPLIGLSPCMASLHGSLTSMQQTWMADFPPVDQSKARFGNPSFRDWHGRLTKRSVSIVESILLEHDRDHDQQQHDNNREKIYDLDVLKAAAERGAQAAHRVEEKNLESITEENDRRTIVQELCAYLHDAFGHPVRLDYGTGHESSFQVFLFSLCKLGCFGGGSSSSSTSASINEPPSVERLKAITISIYSAYLQVCRPLQTDYMLEPAGSHGVWGLDDYHCLPFYFGACQLQAAAAAEGGDGEEHDYASPSSIHDASIMEQDGGSGCIADKYLYFGCIRHIKALKKGVPFFESSPMLNDISMSLDTWQKVAAGLLRLYEGEVLKKRQVVQHFVFGNIFCANWEPSEEPREPPTGPTTFRTNAARGGRIGGPVAPMARAPWASGGGGGGASSSAASPPMPPSTKAPWAK